MADAKLRRMPERTGMTCLLAFASRARHAGAARFSRHLALRAMAAACAVLAAGNAAAQGSAAAADFAGLSLEELADIEITSVSKRPEPLSSAAASIYVITREDIRRSGATTIPEMLRLAPNLQVARVDASQYAISARGFNSTTANKLLVLIDGRSVYTPLFSGVFWDVQDVLPENIERIEVLSGPGGTLWGANAVNGVINIITRDSHDTTGTLVSAGAGNDRRDIALRQGGSIGEDASYRLTAKGMRQDETVNASGGGNQDDWQRKDLGFRFDWGRGSDGLMAEGGLYDGSLDQKVFDDKSVSGFHLLGRWNRRLDSDSSLQVQSYVDQTRRVYPGTYGEVLNTWDMDVQHRFAVGRRHDVVWGGGYRFSRDDVSNTSLLAFLPARRDLTLANVFAQDSIALNDRLQLTLGGKLERNNYTGLEFQPNARLAWKLRDNALLWSAISRSVRTPSRIDRDFFVPAQAPFLIAGGPDFVSEKLTTYELGYRMQPASYASFSASVFYNDYKDLRSVEPMAGSGAPFVLANKMEGNSYGVEMWGTYRVSDSWRLSAGYNYLKQDLRLAPDSRDVAFGTAAAGNDPRFQLSLRSSMNLAHNVEFDVTLRKIGSLPNPSVPGYTQIDMRLGWKVRKDIEISLSGFNLLGHRHPEFGTDPTRSELGRRIYLKTLWSF
jgi:iron complex outermembrane receptor protein